MTRSEAAYESATCSSLRALTSPVIMFLILALLPLACGKDLSAPPSAAKRIVTGTVTNSTTGKPVADAKVKIGTAVFETGPTGRFRFAGVAAGSATIRCTATSFVDFETDILVSSDSITSDIGLTRIEVFEFGDFALYVPATVESARGLIIALGGPDTRGFATGKPMGAPVPAVEASLQALGKEFRTLASSRDLAILGVRSAMTNDGGSDQRLREAVGQAGTMSRRESLWNVPMLIYGLSVGGPQASGFAARNPFWVMGLFLKVPVSVSTVSGYALGVPTYIVLAERDTIVDNAALKAGFESNRAAGALWALAEEPGVIHHSLTQGQRQLTINWISTILDRRLPPPAGSAEFWGLDDVAETTGWLVNGSTGAAAPWATYAGNRALASWVPSEGTAQEWQSFAKASGN